MSQPPSIKDVLTEEGYQRFLDKGIGEKLSGTQFDADAPANGLFWAMFRRAEEQRREADEQAELIDELQKDVERYVGYLQIKDDQNEHQRERLERQAHLIVRLEKTIARLAMEATDDRARLEAYADGF
jgi:hypothetical protein